MAKVIQFLAQYREVFEFEANLGDLLSLLGDTLCIFFLIRSYQAPRCSRRE